MVSALLTAFSEAVYWYSGGTDFAFRAVAYLIPTTGLLWVLARIGGLGWPCVILAGAVYGFLTEGVLTPVAYGGFPFDPFAISYTSLAWHALVTVGFGLVLLRRLILSRSAMRSVALLAASGVFWGVWAMSLRLPAEPDDELAGLSVLVGQVEVGVFALYAAAVTCVIALCHLLLGRAVLPADLIPWRGLSWAAVIVGAVWFAALVVPAAPWAPVELAVLLLVCRWGLMRLPCGVRPGALTALVGEPLPAGRVGRLAAIPIAATATYWALVRLGPDEDTIRTFCLDVVVTVQTLAGWALFVAALVVAYRSGRPSNAGSPRAPSPGR